MIRRHVLAALAAGIAAGDDDAARRALRSTDYVVRGRARRRLERALIDAALATMETPSDADGAGPRPGVSTDLTSPEAVRHVQRLAALTVAGRAPDDPHDRERVTAAYATLPSSSPPRLPIATIAASTLALALVTGVTAYAMTRPDPPSRVYVRPLPPPVAGAFKDGGVPLEDPALATLLVEELTSLVLETDRDRRGGGTDKDRAAHAITLISAPAITRHGPELVRAWAAMLGMLDRWVSVPQSSEEFIEIAREFRHRVRAVSDQLAASGIGYWLEGDVLSRGSEMSALIYAYRVEEVVFVMAGTDPRRVLSLRRLDRLNLKHTLLGMQSLELGDPVVLLDQIDQHVATHVLPTLAPDAAFELADEEYQRTTGRAISELTGRAVRDELAAALGRDASAAHEIAALLAERAAMIDDWRDVLQRKGYRLARTDDLFLPPGMIDAVDGDVPGSQRRRATEIEARLAVLEAPRIASRCHELVTATVRRHEAQHGLDDDRRTPLRYPKVLEANLGPAVDGDGEPRRSAERGRAELSAYVSQLANDVATPQLTLWNVARFAFNRQQWGTPESYAGVILVEGLARQLQVPSSGPVIHDREIDRTRLSALALPLTRLPADQLRAAARALWTELYGEDLVPIVDR